MGNLLALVTKAQLEVSTIDTICDANGVAHMVHADILHTFHQFYEDLYSSKATPSELLQYLDECPFPRILEAEQIMFDSPITSEELTGSYNIVIEAREK